jgi:hypothetical protein
VLQWRAAVSEQGEKNTFPDRDKGLKTVNIISPDQDIISLLLLPKVDPPSAASAP